MGRRTFIILAAVSLFSCIATCVQWVRDAPDTTGLRIANDAWIGVFGGRTSIYNRSRPYRGSIIGVSTRGKSPAQPAAKHFDFAGVYYRHRRWRDGHTYWTLTTPTVYFVVVTAILPGLWLYKRRSVKASAAGIYQHRGYDLRATPPRCPECGMESRRSADPG